MGEARSETKGRVTISRRGAERLRAGHVWVYRSEVAEARDVQPGALVTVQEEALFRPKQLSGKSVRLTGPRVLGSALYSTASEIAVRMISSKPVSDLEQLVRERIRAAIAYRGRFVENTNAYRVIFSEADFLPGLIVDRYNDLLSMQIVTQAMDAEAMRGVVVSELLEAFNPVAIVERVDPRVRRLEQLAEKESGVIYERTRTLLAGETPSLQSLMAGALRRGPGGDARLPTIH